MIEITVMNFLENIITDIPVLLEVPEEPPAKYIVVRKTGSDVENHIYEATLAIQSYAPSLYEAIVLNGRVLAAMDDMSPANGVFSAKLNSDYEYTDTSTKEYRYQAVFQVYY